MRYRRSRRVASVELQLGDVFGKTRTTRTLDSLHTWLGRTSAASRRQSSATYSRSDACSRMDNRNSALPLVETISRRCPSDATSPTNVRYIKGAARHPEEHSRTLA